MVQPILAYPGVPSLSWVLASRVCNSEEESDVFCVLSGRKGSGKSTASLALCEDIAECVAYIHGKGEDPKEFFNISHVVSVTKEGAVRLLTSGILKKRNSVILLDDVKRFVLNLIQACGSLQWNSRNFQTWINKALNDILTVARVYSCVIIANCVQTSHIDKIARELTDYRIEMMRKSTVTKQSVLKCFYFDLGPDGGEYRRYLTWGRHRIRQWVCGLPSAEIRKQYTEMRHANTDAHLDSSYERMVEKLDGKFPKVDGRTKDYSTMTIVTKNMDRVKALLDDGKRPYTIARETGLSQYWVQRIVGEIKK